MILYLDKEYTLEKAYERVVIIIYTVAPENQWIVLGDYSIGRIMALDPFTNTTRISKIVHIVVYNNYTYVGSSQS